MCKNILTSIHCNVPLHNLPLSLHFSSRNKNVNTTNLHSLGLTQRGTLTALAALQGQTRNYLYILHLLLLCLLRLRLTHPLSQVVLHQEVTISEAAGPGQSVDRCEDGTGAGQTGAAIIAGRHWGGHWSHHCLLLT